MRRSLALLAKTVLMVQAVAIPLEKVPRRVLRCCSSSLRLGNDIDPVRGSHMGTAGNGAAPAR
jgi:hypothetical protein